MDKSTFAIIKADIEGQLALIEEVFNTLEQRASDLEPGREIQLESTVYQLHNLYNAVEDLLKVVAGHFENRVTDTAHWHVQLLRRMRQDIPGIRPALLSPETFTLLNGLRAFRHFFRPAYATPIDYEQLHSNLDRARRLRPHLQRDVARFLAQLDPDVEIDA